MELVVSVDHSKCKILLSALLACICLSRLGAIILPHFLFFFFQLGKSGFCTNILVEIHVLYCVPYFDKSV